MTFFRNHKKISITIAVVVLLIIGWVSLSFLDHANGQEPIWGVSFAPTQAEYLGLDWKETYIAILDDLNVDAVRLAAMWNTIERERGVYDFSDLDFQINEAAKRDKRIILAVGRRLPRWPECHEPEWLHGKTHLETEADLRALITATVERYRDISQIAMWQVENEFFLTVFGDCPAPDRDVIAREIELVRSLDDRSILTTDSGELSSWRQAAPLGDYFGTTMYRVVWNPWTGFWKYDYILPPFFYRMKARLVGKPIDHMIGAELQGEPWTPEGQLNLSDGSYLESMSPAQLKKNVDFARRTGFREHYLWGAEIWYFLKIKANDRRLWDAAKTLWAHDEQ